MSSQSSSSVPAPIVALATWVVPGSGYWLIGQRARALTVGITILSLFVLGLVIGGTKVVDLPPGVLSSPVNAVSQKPWFVGQILAGPITLLTASVGRSEDYFPSHSRVNEIGTLYTAVAGMLNLLAIIDAAYRAGHDGGAR
ncbi:MAG TPA: DUF6677 family protein [Tepidisphaeraceae bacterium]|jgi:hypothetical protein|nr:DUF6677 family protein [Tepidisphaeraceae bacterium]